MIPSDTLPLFYKDHFVTEDTVALTRYHSARELASGIEAEPLSYSLHTDNVIALILLGCFLLSAVVLARSKKLLAEMLKGFLFHRERASLFSVSTVGEARFLLLLLVQTCVLGGFCMLNFFLDTQPAFVMKVSPHLLLGIYVGVWVVYLFVKWIIYLFLGWIFLDKTKLNIWMESYVLLVYYLGFMLFPLVLLLVYFDLNLVFLVTISAVLLIFTKILMFYKWIKLFFDNIFGLFLLIVYFCALEIIPFLLIYRGMIELNELLVIKI